MATLTSSLSPFHSPTPLFNHLNPSSYSGLLFYTRAYPNKSMYSIRRLIAMAAKKSKSGEDNNGNGKEEDPSNVPSWAKPGSDEPPPWARQEAQNDSSTAFEAPFYVYLLASAITAIAAIGSIFEYVNQKPVFGVLNPDSIFYAPLLGFFAFTGIPSSAFLWFKSVQIANKEAEEQDRRDGYL